MKRLAILLFAASASAPALAQHGGHAAPPPQPVQADPHAGHAMPPVPPPPACPPEHAAMGHCPAPPPPAPPPPAPPLPAPPACPPEHAAMGHCPPPAAAPAQADPHAGHAMPAAPAEADRHAAHPSAVAAEPEAPPTGPPPPEALRGPAHAADAFFGEQAMGAARERLRRSHGVIRSSRVGVDLLEAQLRSGRDGFAWEDLHFRHGGDINRLLVTSEGEAAFGEGIERAEVQALWSRAIAPFFDLQAGLRYDVEPNPNRGHLVLGIQGLAPYWFEVDAALFLSNEGELTARFEGEYDQRITQRLILQPRIEADFSLQDIPELGIGTGLSAGEAGIRLRYQFVPEFAPYVGVQYERAFGDSARFRRAAGGDVGGWSLVMGVRAWF